MIIISTIMIPSSNMHQQRFYNFPDLHFDWRYQEKNVIFTMTKYPGGAHIYGGGLTDYPLARQKGKEVWMTEHYTTSDRSANLWPDAFWIYQGLTK